MSFDIRGCVRVRGLIYAAAGASALGLIQADDGTNNNRIVARIIAAGTQAEALVVSGGVTTATMAPLGVLPVAAPFVVLMAWSPGGVRFGTTAGGVASASVARPGGLSRVMLGNADASGALPLIGEILNAQYFDFYPSVAEALAILSASGDA